MYRRPNLSKIFRLIREYIWYVSLFTFFAFYARLCTTISQIQFCPLYVDQFPTFRLSPFALPGSGLTFGYWYLKTGTQRVLKGAPEYPFQ